MGAGAIGCYYGAMLARSGAQVVLIGRSRHVKVVQARGLMLETGAGTEQSPLRATTEAAGVPTPANRVLHTLVKLAEAARS